MELEQTVYALDATIIGLCRTLFDLRPDSTEPDYIANSSSFAESGGAGPKLTRPLAEIKTTATLVFGGSLAGSCGKLPPAQAGGGERRGTPTQGI